MITGTVEFFNAQRGFGFIRPDSGAADLFVHIKQLERAGLTSLSPGQRIQFEAEPPKGGGKSDRAINIALIN